MFDFIYKAFKDFPSTPIYLKKVKIKDKNTTIVGLSQYPYSDIKYVIEQRTLYGNRQIISVYDAINK
jgi:hypothetical protein